MSENAEWLREQINDARNAKAELTQTYIGKLEKRGSELLVDVGQLAELIDVLKGQVALFQADNAMLKEENQQQADELVRLRAQVAELEQENQLLQASLNNCEIALDYQMPEALRFEYDAVLAWARKVYATLKQMSEGVELGDWQSYQAAMFYAPAIVKDGQPAPAEEVTK